MEAQALPCDPAPCAGCVNPGVSVDALARLQLEMGRELVTRGRPIVTSPPRTPTKRHEPSSSSRARGQPAPNAPSKRARPPHLTVAHGHVPASSRHLFVTESPPNASSNVTPETRSLQVSPMGSNNGSPMPHGNGSPMPQGNGGSPMPSAPSVEAMEDIKQDPIEDTKQEDKEDVELLTNFIEYAMHGSNVRDIFREFLPHNDTVQIEYLRERMRVFLAKQASDFVHNF